MHLYPRRWHVDAQVVEELKTVPYATPHMEERREKREKIPPTNSYKPSKYIPSLAMRATQSSSQLRHI